MKKIIFKDLNNWKNLNKDHDFSCFDYIYQIFKLKKIDSDLYFALSKMFWPDFVVVGNYTFLKESFSQKKFNDLLSNNKKVEFWMNFLLIDPYFEEDDDGDERAESLARILVNLWQVKLKTDFSDREFIVEYLSDAEVGDYGLTFYRSEANKDEEKGHGNC